MKPRRLCLAAIIFLLLLSWPFLLWAHKVSIYAWVEGDRVFTESFLSSGDKAAHSQIEVFDKHGKKLLAGKTDNQGMFSFKLPQKSDLKIVLRAGGGHRAEFNLKAEDIPLQLDHPGEGHAEENLSMVGAPCIGAEEIQAVVEKVLDEKLRPLQKRLAAYEKRGPGITEIFGGIGYIIGLIGVASYFSHRKKGPDQGAGVRKETPMRKE